MAPSAHSARILAERGLARPIRQRSPLVERDSVAPSQSPTAVSASPSPSQTGLAGVNLPPHGATALIGIVVVLSVCILGFAGWRVWVWRRNKAAALVASSEKGRKEAGLYDSIHTDYGVKRTLSQSSFDTVVILPAGPKAAMTRERSPAEFMVNLGYEPKVIYSAPVQHKGQGIPPPGIKITPATSSLQINPPPTYVEVAAPAPSPRTTSRAPTASAIPSSTKLPRLVIVDATFTATLHDELEIREGETLRLLEEYEDEWCLVQRVGKADAEKGVVPRFCVIDKPEVAPSTKSTHIPRLPSVNKL